MREILEKVKNSVLDVLFPSICMGCGKEGRYICARCKDFVGEVALICPACQQSNFGGEQHHNCRAMYGLEGLASVWEYEGIMKSLLHYVKYTGVTHAVEETTRHAFETMAKDKSRFGTFLSFLFSENVFVTYIPMHKKKGEETRI